MLWDTQKRKYWDIETNDCYSFRLSKDRCQKFMEALLRCNGKIHDMYSLDVSDGSYRYNMKVHQIDVQIRISLPEGAENLFGEIMGDLAYLKEPMKISFI